MYHFLGVMAKKGASSLQLLPVPEEFKSARHKQIILFSDACGGQNQNYVVFSSRMGLQDLLESLFATFFQLGDIPTLCTTGTLVHLHRK